MYTRKRSILILFSLTCLGPWALAQTYPNDAVQNIYGAITNLENRVQIDLNRLKSKIDPSTPYENTRKKLTELKQLQAKISKARRAAQALMRSIHVSSHPHGVDDSDPQLKTMLAWITQIKDQRYFAKTLDIQARNHFNQSVQRLQESTGPSAPALEQLLNTPSQASTSSAPHPTEGCPDISLDAPHQSAHGLSVKDQKNESICYGIVAADLIDSYRQAYVPSSPFRPVSPLILSIETERANLKKHWSGISADLKNLNFSEKEKELDELKKQSDELEKEEAQRQPHPDAQIDRIQRETLKKKK
jgi:hypothetical protein